MIHVAGFNNDKAFTREKGMSLVEVLVAIALLTIVIGAITSMVIQSMKSQQEVTADYRSQLNIRQALYDMEKNIAEAKRRDNLDNEPVFQGDLISIPSQNNDEWITYWYTNTHPLSAGKYTIVKVVTDVVPTFPMTVEAGDKQVINVDPEDTEESTVERVAPDAPIFRYFDANGDELASPVVSAREVRSVEISLMSTVSVGHSKNEPAVSSTRIKLRNF